MNLPRPSKRFLTRLALLAVLGIYLSLASGAAYASEGQPKNLYMVSIGETYDKNKGAQPQVPLPCCAKDAHDMAQWGKAQKGKLFEHVDVTTIVDTEATAADILKALRGLADKTKAGDYAIVYMSGHGGRGCKEYVFCAHDRNVAWSEIREALREAKGRILIILDACQSGAVIDNGNMIVLAAALADQGSIGYSNPQTNSLYTRLLLEALNGKADMNKDGLISLAEVDAYVSGQLALKAGNPESTLLRPANVPSSLPLAKLQVQTASAAAPLAGTTWSGKECVSGYSALTFQFQSGGKVTMIDAQNTVHGTYTQDGNAVTITLPGVAVYTGTVNGASLTGQGSCDSLGTWSYAVSKK